MQYWTFWGHLSLQSRQGLLEDTLSETVSWDPGDMVALGVQGACAVELPLGTSRLASFQQAEFLGESQVPQPPQGGGAHPPQEGLWGRGSRSWTAHFLPSLVRTQHAVLLWFLTGFSPE